MEEEVVDGVPPEIGLVLKKGGKIQIFQIFSSIKKDLHFSVIQNLCEINFGECQSLKMPCFQF